MTCLIKETEEVLKRPKEATSEKDLNMLLGCLSLLQTQLKDVNDAIEPYLEEQDTGAEFEQVYEYADKLVRATAKVKYRARCITKGEKQLSQANSMGTSQASGAQVTKLKHPNLELLKFNGQQKNWLPFWEQFETAVHQNSHLTKADKFNYLRSALTGEGAAEIAGLQPSDSCYKQAIDLLVSRFGNQAAMIQDHTEGIKKVHDRNEVCLPWKPDAILSDNMNLAQNRLNNLVKKPENNSKLLEEYDQAIPKHHPDGVAKELPAKGESEALHCVYYMPIQRPICDFAAEELEERKGVRVMKVSISPSPVLLDITFGTATVMIVG